MGGGGKVQQQEVSQNKSAATQGEQAQAVTDNHIKTQHKNNSSDSCALAGNKRHFLFSRHNFPAGLFVVRQL